MFFTQDDYKKIQQWLTKNSVKDTEFNEANIPFNGNEVVSIVQGDQNKKVFLKDLVSQIFNLGVSDFVNITDKYDAPNISLEEAIKLIPSRARKEGQVITFLDRENHWHIYQFKGALNQWNVLDTWEDLFDWEKLIIDSILPDEEDLTKTLPDKNGNSYLSFKNKRYNKLEFSGLGKVYLRKNIINGVNTLLQKDINKDNTIYIIQYDYDLNGSTIEIPEGCVLDFEGGMLSNGEIIGNNTVVRTYPIQIFSSNITLSGSWGAVSAYPEWFGAKGDGITDDTTSINMCIDVFANNFTNIFLGRSYAVSTINISKECIIQGTPSTKIIHIGEGVCVNVAPTNEITSWHQFVRTKIFDLSIYLNEKSTVGLRVNQCVGSLFERIYIYGANSSVPNIENQENPADFDNVKSKGVFVDGSSNVEVNGNSIFNNIFNRVVSNRVDIGFDINGIFSDSKFYNIESNTVGQGVRINTYSSFNITFEDCQFVDTNVGFNYNNCTITSFIRGCNIEMYRYYAIYKKSYPNNSIINICSNGITTKHDTKISDIHLNAIVCSQISNNTIGWGAPSGISDENLTPSQKSDISGNIINCTIFGNKAQNGSDVTYSKAIFNRNFVFKYGWVNNKDTTQICGNNYFEHLMADNFELFNNESTLQGSLKGDRFVSLKKHDGIELFIPTGINSSDMTTIKDAAVGTPMYREDLDVPIWRNSKWQWQEYDGCVYGVIRRGVHENRPIGDENRLYSGFTYYDKNYKIPLFFNEEDKEYRRADGSPVEAKNNGTTEDRPSDVPFGFAYFDQTLNKPIWWMNSKWIDATGTEV